jgi:type I restriction enzyme S subunit
MNNWIEMELGKAILFNPPERIAKGAKAKKIPMDKLGVFKKKIKGFEISEYTAGPKFRNGDTLVAKITPCLENGKTAQVDILNKDEIAFGSSEFIVLRENEYTVNDYIFYLAMSPAFRKRAISCMEGTSGRKRVNEGALKLQVLPIPSKETQMQIASVLSSLDSKIELNNKINAELEAMAQTIYDYWFVQFDFPNAKGMPYKTSGGKMVWNAELKREIPQDWGVALMQDWLDVNKSGDWGKEEPQGNFTIKVSCIRGADINGINGKGECNPPVRYILEKNTSKILNTHDLVIEISGGGPTQSTGRLTYITDETIKRFENPLICSNFCRPVSIKNKKLLYNFVYYWNSLYDAGIFFGYEGKTSGIKNLLLDSFISSYYTVVPDDTVVNKFYDIMENIQAKKQTALAENKKLAELRDWLLPMLMNGQVSVGEAEKAVNEKMAIAAEPEIAYEKSNISKLPIPETKKSFAKQVLAGKIMSLFREEKEFTDIKFQKIQYLAEHIAEADLNLNYYRKMAGPYDNVFMHTVYSNMKNNKWFEDRKKNFKPLAKVNEIDKYYQTYFSPTETKLNKLFKLLKNASEAHSEVIATVYAIWNNMLINGETPANDKIVKLFFEWSTRKEAYTEKQILDTIKLLKEKGFEPAGFGYLIKEVKGK